MDDGDVKHLPWTGERLVPTCRGQVLYEHLHRYAIAVSLAKGKRVLDIACGEGYGSNLLAATAAHVIGVDIDAETIAHAKQAYRKENLNFLEGSCLSIPVENHSVDLVVSFETIEHIEEHEQFLCEIQRVLSKDGVLIISSPDKREYADRKGNKNPFHKLELYHEDFHRLLKRHFNKCRIGKQRLVVGSWIAPDRAGSADVFGSFSGDIRSVEFEPGVRNGLYSIALCSDGKLPQLNLGVFENKRDSENTWSLLERSVSTPMFQVFADHGEAFTEASSMVASLQPNVWQTVKLENLERLSIGSSRKLRRYRIDPVDRPAFVAISKILIIREFDGAILYSATCPADFDRIECSAGLLKHSNEEGMLLIATDSDPQMYLPPIDYPNSDPCRLEVTLQVALNPGDVVTRYHRALKDRSVLATMIELSNVKLAAIADDILGIREKAAEDARQLGRLEEQNHLLQTDRLSAEIRDLKNSVETGRVQLATKNSQNIDLASQVARLEETFKQFSVVFGVTPERMRDSSSPAVVLISSLFRKIRLIRRRSFLWKAFRLLPGSDGNSLPKPKVTAEELKQKLEEIKRTLKAKKTSPAAALGALSELIALQKRIDQVLTSLKGKSLLGWKRNSGRTSNKSSLPGPTASRLSTLLDSTWYLRKNPNVAKSGIDPLHHYITCGGQQGLDPHPLFDTKWYLSQKPERETVGVTPLEDYLLHGAREGLSPHPQFDATFYAKNNPASVQGDTTPLEHYLTAGWKLGYWPNPHFDPNFYLHAYADVATAKMEPLTHFLLAGEAEGRSTCEDAFPFELHQPTFAIPSQPTIPLDSSPAPKVKAIAFYLPQYHPIPENNLWWGEGFTEWTNVRGGRPNFAGHYQPHVPTTLGYYDLREATVLQQQTELARAYGIYGFCFYYYWFAGKVLLDLPIRTMLESGKPDFPFCICWANENWTRRWDGLEKEILISQNHSPEDDLNFVRKIEQVLLSKNYIRVHDKPMLLVYRPSLFPHSIETTETWRDYFRRQGHGELHLTMVRSFHDQTAPEIYGFDAAVQFPPHFPAVPITQWISDKDERFTGGVHDYLQLRRVALEQLVTNAKTNKTYAAVMPSWDNTARRGANAVVCANSSPEAYYEWLATAVEQVEKQADPDDRLIFINAWNEWAEGCHLEPDERFGFAWLNATSLALHEPPQPSQQNDPSRIIPPAEQCIEVPRLPATVRLIISVLFYHRDDLIPSFLKSILPQIRSAKSRGDISCRLYLAFNYKAAPSVQTDISSLIDSVFPEGANDIYIRKNGFNIGFGAGHNAIFQESESDLFLMLNSDVRVLTENWLEVLVRRFRESDAALIGLAETASKLREDGCGIPIERPSEQFDFVDGSVLAIRSELARRYGLFSDAFDYFYFEDVDLCLRYRQMGLRLDLLEIPYEHDRSSSSRLLPQYAVEGVLNRNRARFFERWGGYLQTRKLPNRLGLRFLDIDRQLQCASLPALFALLSDHPGATLDISGLHEQLIPIFKHPRIRLIPFWKTLQKDDYLRYYEIEGSSSADQPLTVQIADTVGCVPDFEAARAHLKAIASGKVAPTFSSIALLYVARTEPLFDGRQPNPKCYAAAEELLSRRGFQIQLWTELGTFEVEKLPFGKGLCKHAAMASGLELLYDIAQAELVVSSDNWISELSQLLNKKTFLWLGATSPACALWNLEQAGFFVDRTLSCLGCYHCFGRDNHNTCLRGDTACMRQELTDGFIAALERFLEGSPVTAAEIRTGRQPSGRERSMPSTHLSLDRWPRSSAASVLVLIPVSPSRDKATVQRAEQLARRAIEGMRGSRVVLDDRGEAPLRGVPHVERQASMAALRQLMVERYLKDEAWIFWVDADITDYPADLIDMLIARAEGGIAAPLVLMEGSISEPARPDGFGPGRFYDIAGFIENGRWARFTEPYFDQPGPVYKLASVGGCYLVNADLYRDGARHEQDSASKAFLSSDGAWPADAISRNQAGSANSLTEHHSVCAFAREAGLPVQAFADLIAYHEKT